MQKFTLLTAAVLGGLTVLIGAFGAHLLKDILVAHGRIDAFQTAVKYQIFHVLTLLFLGLLMSKIETQWFNYACFALIAGIFLFSGSLYILSLSGASKWGAVTPLGGICFLAGWIMIFVGLWKGL